MADTKEFFRKYTKYISTFKKTSFDSDNKEYLCYDETQNVIDFDKIIEEKYPDSNIRPKSFDAIYIHNRYVFCVEFKNQKFSQINNKDIQKKLVDGKEELTDIFASLNIPVREYNFIYCVAYKKTLEPLDRYKCGVAKGSIQFGLEQYKTRGFVKDVFTNNVDFFTQQFIKQLNKELEC